jgi:hypothetical protein
LGTKTQSTTDAPKNVSRRRVVAGAAWAVPAVVVASAAPAMAASPCEVKFETTQASAKCCNGRVKNMKVVFQVTDVNNCVGATDQICITDVQLGNGQDRGTLVNANPCTVAGGTITIYLLDTDSCTVNLVVSYTVDGGPTQTAEVKSDNIPSGNSDADCCPNGDCTP